MNKKFEKAAVIGGAGESVVKGLLNGRAGIKEIYYLDSSEAMLRRVHKVTRALGFTQNSFQLSLTICSDEINLAKRFQKLACW